MQGRKNAWIVGVKQNILALDAEPTQYPHARKVKSLSKKLTDVGKE